MTDDVELPPVPPRLRRMALPGPGPEGLAFVGTVLGALTTADGTPPDLQLRLLRALVAARAGRELPEVDLAAVPRLSPAEAGEAVGDADQRTLLVQLLVTMELLLHPLPDALARQVDAYADALGVHPDALQVARDLAEEHQLLAYADLQRMSWYRSETFREARHGRLVELARSKLAYYGIGRDRRIARRWEALADLPRGTWGGEVAEFYRVHGFPFPGEPHGIYEIGAHHDFVHVLADYPPTPEGEIDVFAFIAATMEDPRGYMQFAFTLALFQNATVDRVGGLKVAIARADTLEDPGAVARLADAFRRAVACPVDVMAGVDHFAWAAVPLDEARSRLGVVPRAVAGEGYLAT